MSAAGSTSSCSPRSKRGENHQHRSNIHAWKMKGDTTSRAPLDPEKHPASSYHLLRMDKLTFPDGKSKKNSTRRRTLRLFMKLLSENKIMRLLLFILQLFPISPHLLLCWKALWEWTPLLRGVTGMRRECDGEENEAPPPHYSDHAADSRIIINLHWVTGLSGWLVKPLGRPERVDNCTCTQREFEEPAFTVWSDS